MFSCKKAYLLGTLVEKMVQLVPEGEGRYSTNLPSWRHVNCCKADFTLKKKEDILKLYKNGWKN